MASCWIFKSKKSAWIMMIYVVKCTFSRHFFWTSRFNSSPFWSQLRLERVIYFKRKLFYRFFESNFETGRIFAMGCSRQVWVQVMLFQFLGVQFSPDSKSFLSGLSNGALFVSEFISKDDKRKQKVWAKNLGVPKLIIWHHFELKVF